MIASLDVGMPEVSGHELCAELKQWLKGDLMAAFAIGGWSTVGDVALAKETRFNQHFATP